VALKEVQQRHQPGPGRVGRNGKQTGLVKRFQCDTSVGISAAVKAAQKGVFQMGVIIEMSIFPMDKGESVSQYVARAIKIIQSSGLPHEMNPMGTCIEGEWDEVMDVVNRCFEVLTKDCNRINLSLKADYRKGTSNRMKGKVASVKEKLSNPCFKGAEALVKEILEKGEATKYRILFQNVKGEKFEIGLNAIVTQRDENGKAVSYQGIAHNITEAIRLKELEAISQMAGCFADDLASPLMVITMGVETVISFLPDVEKLTEKLSGQVATIELAEIVNGIQSQIPDVNFFLNQVVIAVDDVTKRLNEIREQYSNLQQVPDGSGGIIYQRATRAK
jgi:uncharacterized protein (TIGR00106 family)